MGLGMDSRRGAENAKMGMRNGLSQRRQGRKDKDEEWATDYMDVQAVRELE